MTKRWQWWIVILLMKNNGEINEGENDENNDVMKIM